MNSKNKTIKRKGKHFFLFMVQLIQLFDFVSWCPVNRVAASLPARARPPSAVSRRDGCRGNGSLRSHVPRHPPAAIVSPLPGARGLVGDLPAP